MSNHYSDQTRENDPRALPNVEVFYMSEDEARQMAEYPDETEAGWYYWYCFPGCMPDSDPMGPFDTEFLAVEDAREDAAQSVELNDEF